MCCSLMRDDSTRAHWLLGHERCSSRCWCRGSGGVGLDVCLWSRGSPQLTGLQQEGEPSAGCLATAAGCMQRLLQGRHTTRPLPPPCSFLLAVTQFVVPTFAFVKSRPIPFVTHDLALTGGWGVALLDDRAVWGGVWCASVWV